MNAEFKIDGRVIMTERLILRAFRDSDLADFNAYCSVEGVGERAGWKHHESLEESRGILEMFMQEDKTFAICLKDTDTDRVIGSLGVEKYGMEDKLTEFDGYKGRELGYVLSRDYWGKGFMTEAVKAVINCLFYECGMDFLTCGYFDSNAQSKRVQEKCGFKPYRKLVFNTLMGTKEPGVLSLIKNPAKKIEFIFSHPETLIVAD